MLRAGVRAQGKYTRSSFPQSQRASEGSGLWSNTSPTTTASSSHLCTFHFHVSYYSWRLTPLHMGMRAITTCRCKEMEPLHMPHCKQRAHVHLCSFRDMAQKRQTVISVWPGTRVRLGFAATWKNTYTVKRHQYMFDISYPYIQAYMYVRRPFNSTQHIGWSNFFQTLWEGMQSATTCVRMK